MTQVYLVTGATSGVGLALAGLLYGANATVLAAGRNQTSGDATMRSIRAAHPSSAGTLEFIEVNLDNLSSVAACARAVLSRDGGSGGGDGKLDVLFCNAGVMHPPPGSATAQGHELQVGVNCLGHVLLAEMLAPLLARTAASAGRGAVRVVWVTSLYAETGSPEGGFEVDNLGFKKRTPDKYAAYAVSKAGAFYQAVEFGRRYEAQGIVSVVRVRYRLAWRANTRLTDPTTL